MIDKSFIFLAGHHRSGTSLLHEIIRGHPSVSGFSGTGVPEDEGQHLQSVYPPAKVYGGPGNYIFDDNAYMDEHHELATVHSAMRILEQWGRYYNLKCEHFIEKSPPNLIRTKFLQALFPNSKFVVIFRHPLAVAYATQKWSNTSIKSLVEHTLRGYEIFIKDMLGLDRVYVLRYEDFVAAPQAEIDKVHQFLNLDKIPIQHKVHPDVNSKYFSRWCRDRERPWNRLWFPINADLEKRANRFGYSINKPEDLLTVSFLGASTNKPHFSGSCRPHST